MSNEVNQAYLRAYVKNRAANAPSAVQRHPSSRSLRTENGESIRRVDSGNYQAATSMQPPHTEINRAQPALDATAPPTHQGVWSPIGVERAVKGTNAKSSQSAVVVNPASSTSRSTTPSVYARTTVSPPRRELPPEPETDGNDRSIRSHQTVAPVSTPTNHPPSIRIDRSHSAPQAHSARQNRQETPNNHSANRPSSRLEPNQQSERDAARSLPLPVAFTPSWEVDKFFWPEVVLHLQKTHGNAFQQIGKHLRLANQDGLKVMAVTSGERGVGRSTVSMHMARCAADAGLTVALMDADVFYPSMIDQLRLDMAHGWQDCLFENVPLEEVAVRSLEDRITLFPLTSVISQQQLHANLHRVSKIVKRLSTAFDLVLLDSNRLNLEQRDLVGVAQESVVDAAVVVMDTELSIKEKIDTAVSILHGMGISSIGLVENFHS